MASLLLGFHRNMPTLKPIALGEFSESEIGLAAAWANELDQVKALVDRAVGLYQTFYPRIFRRRKRCSIEKKKRGSKGLGYSIEGREGL
jgi:hypothetical protein